MINLEEIKILIDAGDYNHTAIMRELLVIAEKAESARADAIKECITSTNEAVSRVYTGYDKEKQIISAILKGLNDVRDRV